MVGAAATPGLARSGKAAGKGRTLTCANFDLSVTLRREGDLGIFSTFSSEFLPSSSPPPSSIWWTVVPCSIPLLVVLVSSRHRNLASADRVSSFPNFLLWSLGLDEIIRSPPSSSSYSICCHSILLELSIRLVGSFLSPFVAATCTIIPFLFLRLSSSTCLFIYSFIYLSFFYRLVLTSLRLSTCAYRLFSLPCAVLLCSGRIQWCGSLSSPSLFLSPSPTHWHYLRLITPLPPPPFPSSCQFAIPFTAPAPTARFFFQDSPTLALSIFQNPHHPSGSAGPFCRASVDESISSPWST